MIATLFTLALLSGPAKRTATIQAIPAATPSSAGEMLGGWITGNGSVVGNYRTKGSPSEILSQLWTKSSGSVLIPTPTGATAAPIATCANNKGEVVGSYRSTRAMKPFFWSAKGGVKDLPEMGPYGNATAINDRGDIAGYSIPIPRWAEQGVLLRDGKRIELRAAEGYSYTRVFAINRSGQTVGCCYGSKGPKPGLAMFWDANGTPTTIPLLPNATGQICQSINDKGEALVSASLSDGKSAMFIYREGKIVPIPGTGGLSVPYDLNNKDQVVGQAGLAKSPVLFAFLYENGNVTNLNDLLPPNSGWWLKRAVSINDRGEIVGEGTLKGRDEVFLLRLK